MKIQTVCAFLVWGSVLNVSAFAADKKAYLHLKSVETEVETDTVKQTLKLEIKTKGKIPMDGKSGAFGYAALTDDGNNLLVAVTHLPIDDSSYEKTPSGFHTHVLDLMKPTAACAGANFEVDLVNSGKNKAFDADYSWSVRSEKITIKNVPVTDLGDAGVESVVSFILKPVVDENKSPSNLCIHVVDQK
jgi:hypothetical protein